MICFNIDPYAWGKRRKGTCAISWHRDTIENSITIRQGHRDFEQSSVLRRRPNILIVRNRRSTDSLAIGNDRLLFRSAVMTSMSTFLPASVWRSSRFDYERCVLAAQTDLICHRYEIRSNNWLPIDTSRIVLMVTRRMWSIIISSYNHGISKHRQTFSKNKKFSLLVNKYFWTSTEMLSGSKIHFRRFIIRIRSQDREICL